MNDTTITMNKQIRILIIDDEDLVIKMIKSILSKNTNYDVSSLNSSSSALEHLIDYKYDILLLDGNLPGISGFELLKHCIKQHPYMEVIMISGTKNIQAAVGSMKDGAFDYIQKPFEPTKLLDTIERALKKQEKDINNDFDTSTQVFKKIEDDIFPDYEIIRTLGSGTMGIVSLLQHKNDENDKRALKILKNEDSEGMSHNKKLKRFLREADIMKDIDNENIVKVYESGINNNTTAYILMEYVDGTPLTDFIKKNQLPMEKRIFIIAKLASALHAVHQKGILHRDIKPANVVLTKQLNPKLLDFGIARVADSSLTMQYEVLGSPAYISPEGFEISSSQLTEQSDIFSLGVLSYELLTGQKPFMAETINEITQAIQYKKPVIPTFINPEILERVERIIGKMLEKKMSDRYLSADQIVADFADLDRKRTSLLKRIMRKDTKKCWSK